MTGIVVKSIGLMWLVSVAAPQTQLSEREQVAASQHFKRGMESLLADRYDVAEQEFKGAVAIDPLYDAAFYGLGQVYMATKRYGEALKAYIASRDAFKADRCRGTKQCRVRSAHSRSNRCLERQRAQHDAA